MPQDNLLKQAIADAKAVREAAMANAKAMLEEAFKPQLASMLSTRLRNEADDAVNEDNDNTSGIGSGLTVDEPAPKKPSSAASSSSRIENPGQEVDTMGKGDVHKKPIKEADEFGQEDDELAPDVAAPGAVAPSAPPAGLAGAGAPAAPVAPIAPAVPGAGAEAGMGAAEPDELDLDAIIRELEADLQGTGDEFGAGAPAEPPVASQDEPKLESFQDPQAGAKVKGPLDGSLKEEAEGCLVSGKDKPGVEGVPGGKKVTPGQQVTGTKAERMSEGEEFNLDEILREMEAEEGEAVAETSKIATENVELKRSLREHREVIQYLRTKLQEFHMLNAKLLFTNKLFKSFDLNEGQKVKIVENFDRATTLREVKLVYATLAESLTGKVVGVRRKSSATTAITEGLASKTIASTAPKSQQAILTEGNDVVARLQKLAGIIKA